MMASLTYKEKLLFIQKHRPKDGGDESGALEQGGRRERSRIQLVKVEGRTHKAEEYPSTDHNENGSVGKLVEPEERTLLSHVQLYRLLCNAHVLPIFRRRCSRRSFCCLVSYSTILLLHLSPFFRSSSKPDFHGLRRRHWGRNRRRHVAATAAVDGSNCE